MKSVNRYAAAIQMRSMNYFNQYRGWRTDRKIVVIESDDWGSIRIPSKEVLNYLLDKGVELHPELGYDKYDTLASNSDLENLLEVLSSVKDFNGNPAKITLNCIMTNPDFAKIKASNFTEYHYELFTETLKRYPNHNNAFNLWEEGINNNLFKPQFHGREHLNVQMWMEALRKDYSGVREAFNKEVFCNYIDKRLDARYRFLDAYNVASKDDYEYICNSIKDGLHLFGELFGYKSKSMIAPNYTWDDEVEETAYSEEVCFLQGGIHQKYSEYKRNLLKKNGTFHYM